MKEQDTFLYSMGLYNKIAYEVVMANFGSGLSGKKPSAEYIKHPFLQENENRILTEEEKQKAVDLFFAKENARRINWKKKANK